MQVKTNCIHIARLSFQDEHAGAALFYLRLCQVDKPTSQALTAMVFVHPKFGHANAIRPRFRAQFDHADKRFIGKSAIRKSALPMLLEEFIGIVVFFLDVGNRLFKTAFYNADVPSAFKAG